MNNLNLDELILEFERLSLDERLYFQIINEENLDVAINYNSKEHRPWSVWLICSEKASKQKISNIFLIKVLEAFKVPLAIFYNELSSILLVQAAYANEFIKQVSVLLSEYSVQNSIQQTTEFMEILKSSVNKQLKPVNTDIKLVQNNNHTQMETLIEKFNNVSSKKTVSQLGIENLLSTNNKNKDKCHLKIVPKI